MTRWNLLCCKTLRKCHLKGLTLAPGAKKLTHEIFNRLHEFVSYMILFYSNIGQALMVAYCFLPHLSTIQPHDSHLCPPHMASFIFRGHLNTRKCLPHSGQFAAKIASRPPHFGHRRGGNKQSTNLQGPVGEICQPHRTQRFGNPQRSGRLTVFWNHPI